eukprot:TRINITY_DN7749_c0_g1_i1.p2 TRINITY_DN7749_c0_g1~~TRINITY_DN7749_c0_g1_i1.p2  ORF type:complete len:253 (-),score=87.41 TRINITY_DN7749_c0_g1_i1:1048-1806(-)
MAAGAALQVAALVSGGKDSIYSVMQCVAHGHTVVALVNLRPAAAGVDELDSFMFQTVGHEAVDAVAECLGLPLYRSSIVGSSRNVELDYTPTEADEVENMYEALADVKRRHPTIQAVCSGAILSNYQRNRVNNVCARLGLQSLAYMWGREQAPLLREMIASGLDAILIKVAALGLTPKMLGTHLKDAEAQLNALNAKYGINVCGEGGEYESLVLDCPLYRKRIVIDGYEVHAGVDDVGYMHITKLHLDPKNA